MEHCQLTEDFMLGQNLHYWRPVNAMLPPPVQTDEFSFLLDKDRMLANPLFSL